MEKIQISMPVVVEGKYDKIRLLSTIDANIITTDGFGIFREKEKAALIRSLAEKSGVIIFTDSDGAGLVIRNFFSKYIPRDKIFNLYSPQIKGKEKRKSKPSKAGWLGVEGQDTETLRTLFEPFAGEYRRRGCGLTKLDFFNDGLSGRPGSRALRERLAKQLSLPHDISANALLEAVNILFSKEEYRNALNVAANILEERQ